MYWQGNNRLFTYHIFSNRVIWVTWLHLSQNNEVWFKAPAERFEGFVTLQVVPMGASFRYPNHHSCIFAGSRTPWQLYDHVVIFSKGVATKTFLSTVFCKIAVEHFPMGNGVQAVGQNQGEANNE